MTKAGLQLLFLVIFGIPTIALIVASVMAYPFILFIGAAFIIILVTFDKG